MFDKNLEDFVKSVGFDEIGRIVSNCPDDCDTYLKSSSKYFKGGKQLYYSSDEIPIKSLFYINLVKNGLPCGESFREKLNKNRAEEFLLSIGEL